MRNSENAREPRARGRWDFLCGWLSVLVFALGLAGCTGGDDSVTVDEEALRAEAAKEAEKEITEENAEKVAEDLEKQLNAELSEEP